MTRKTSKAAQAVHDTLTAGVKAKVDGLFAQIADEPEKMTKPRTRGLRQYDRPFLVEGVLYFVVVGFTVDKAKDTVTIRTLVVDEIEGPH
jgi:hypothetical protein